MSPENFCYWLQGYIEVEDPKDISEEKVRMIKAHLDQVFVNKTRAVKDAFPESLTHTGTNQIIC